jgi:hypothetical protein
MQVGTGCTGVGSSEPYTLVFVEFLNFPKTDVELGGCVQSISDNL